MPNTFFLEDSHCKVVLKMMPQTYQFFTSGDGLNQILGRGHYFYYSLDCIIAAIVLFLMHPAFSDMEFLINPNLVSSMDPQQLRMIMELVDDRFECGAMSGRLEIGTNPDSAAGLVMYHDGKHYKMNLA